MISNNRFLRIFILSNVVISIIFVIFWIFRACKSNFTSDVVTVDNCKNMDIPSVRRAFNNPHKCLSWLNARANINKRWNGGAANRGAVQSGVVTGAFGKSSLVTA